MKFFDGIKNRFTKRTIAGLEKYTLHSVPTLASLIKNQEDDGIGSLDLVASYFASLSLKVYRKKDNQSDDEHWFSYLIKNPNVDEVQFNFFYQIAHDYLKYGNVFIYLYIDYRENRPVSIFRLPPNEVYVTRDENLQKTFTYKGKTYTAKNILHIPSRFGYDGTKGKSIFDAHAKTFDIFGDLNTQLQKSTQNYAVEGDRPVLDISEKFDNVSDEQAYAFRDKFIHEYSGSENISKPIVLLKGLKLSSLKGAPLSQKEQQFFENRKEQKEIINEIFGVPQGFTGGDSKFDIEALHILLLGNAIRPIALSVTQYFNKLLDRFDYGTSYVEFNFNTLLRTSLQSRIDSYMKQLGNAVLTPNEIRSLEGRPATKDEAGDNLFIPANLIPLQKEIVDAYLASSRLKLAEAQKKAGEEKNQSGIGDDKK